MKKFNYHSIKDTKEASKLSSANSIFLAGGMTVIPSIKLGLGSYKDVIDIKEIKKLSGIKVRENCKNWSNNKTCRSCFFKRC